MIAALVLAAQTAQLPARAVPFDTAEGRAMLVRSKANADFFALSAHFETQAEQSYCGVASAVMALNALPVAAPKDKWAPYRAFTQENVFAGQTLKSAGEAARGGFTLDELAAFLQAQPVAVETHRAAQSSLEDFRKSAAANLARGGDVVLVNFLRGKLDEEPNGPIEKDIAGHWSPIAAYDEQSDRFLMLDVARYKYPPAWIAAKDLFDAMNTVDVASGASRGWLEVKPGRGVPAPPPVKTGAFLVKIAGAFFAVAFLLGTLVGWLVGRRRST